MQGFILIDIVMYKGRLLIINKLALYILHLL